MGSVSSNPVLAVVEVALVLAWKNAGYLGLDFFLLRKLGARRAPVQPNSAPRTAPRGAAARLSPTVN